MEDEPRNKEVGRRTDYPLVLCCCFALFSFLGVGVQWVRLKAEEVRLREEIGDNVRLQPLSEEISELLAEKRRRQRHGYQDTRADIRGFLDGVGREKGVRITKVGFPGEKLIRDKKYLEAIYTLKIADVTPEKMAKFMHEVLRQRPYLEFIHLELSKQEKQSDQSAWTGSLQISNRYPPVQTNF